VVHSGLTTTAAVLRDPGGPLSIEELQIPELQPGQVLVDLAWSGVCATQLLEARGMRGPDKFIPHTLGHEATGHVAAVGDGVTKVREGDAVVVTWMKGEGADVPSTQYQSSSGETVNSGAVSTFMERTITCENRVVPIPADAPLRESALLGCALPTGAGAVLKTAGVEEGATVAIFGVGGVGLSAVVGAVLGKAERIFAVDLKAPALERAKAAGATDTIDAGVGEPSEAILELTDGRGVDYAIECSGAPPAMEAAFRAVRRGGGLCVLAGNLPHGGRIEIDPFELIAGRRIIGTWGGDTKPDEDIPRYLEMLQDGRLDPTPLLGAEYELAQVDAAIDDLHGGSPGRPLLRLGA
jgi:S-(hydroxymethyl)glutathione dehydrogenase/alcohol dehydrogenase